MTLTIYDLDILGRKEASAFLGITPGALAKLMHKYDIPHKQLGCGAIFLKADLEKFNEERQKNQKYRRYSER